MIIGYTSGVFDLLHIGHINYLKACKAKCDFLIIGVDKDELVRGKKGIHRPYEAEQIRFQKVLNSGFADLVLFKDTSSTKILSHLQPKKYFIPNNRTINKSRINILTSLNIILEIIPYTHGISTSIIEKKMHI